MWDFIKILQLGSFHDVGIASHVVGQNENTGLESRFKVHDVGIASHVVAFKNQGGPIS